MSVMADYQTFIYLKPKLSGQSVQTYSLVFGQPASDAAMKIVVFQTF